MINNQQSNSRTYVICIVIYLGVEHDGADNTGVLHGLAEVVERFLVILVRSVGEVEPSDVHAGTEKLLRHRNRAGRRSERADDLRLGALLSKHSAVGILSRHFPWIDPSGQLTNNNQYTVIINQC
nr:hypothetical protein GW17_00044661 [Ipomoea batatas]